MAKDTSASLVNEDSSIEENADTDETTVPEQEEISVPAPPDNPFWPKEEEKTFRKYVLSSPAYPNKILSFHYPKKIEEFKIRDYVRKLAYDMELSPNDLDTWSQNNFYFAALLKFAGDNEEPVNWLEIEPESRKANEALEATVTMVINWRFLYEDSVS